MQTIYVKRNGYLAHHGVEGQKWGVRRWQNPDGSLTPEGRAHYGISNIENDTRDISSMTDREKRKAYRKDSKTYDKHVTKTFNNDYKEDRRATPRTALEKAKMETEYEKAGVQIRSEAEAALAKKYGEDFINKEMKKDNVRAAIVGGTSMAIIGGAYITALIAERKMDIR